MIHALPPRPLRPQRGPPLPGLAARAAGGGGRAPGDAAAAGRGGAGWIRRRGQLLGWGRMRVWGGIHARPLPGHFRDAGPVPAPTHALCFLSLLSTSHCNAPRCRPGRRAAVWRRVDVPCAGARAARAGTLGESLRLPPSLLSSFLSCFQLCRMHGCVSCAALHGMLAVGWGHAWYWRRGICREAACI